MGFPFVCFDIKFFLCKFCKLQLFKKIKEQDRVSIWLMPPLTKENGNGRLKVFDTNLTSTEPILYENNLKSNCMRYLIPFWICLYAFPHNIFRK